MGGGNFRTTEGGADLPTVGTSLTVPTGTTSLPIWYINQTAGSYIPSLS